MNDRNLVLKAGFALQGRQLLNIHLRTVATRRQRMHGRTFGLWGQILVQNESYRAEGKGAVISPQLPLNANRPVMGMSQPVVNDGLPIDLCHAPVVVFGRTTLVLAVVAFDPFSDCSDGGIELGGQLGVTKLSGGIESLNLLPLAGGKGRIRMKFHQVHS